MSQTLLDMADYMDVCTFGELEEAAAAQDETEDGLDGDDIVIVNKENGFRKDEQEEKEEQDGKDGSTVEKDENYTKMIEEAKL